MKTSESIDKISAALVKAQSEMGNASKDAKNPFYKSRFADLNAIREASIPVLNANNISVLQPMTMVDDRTFVETVLLHSSGQYISSMTEIVVPEAKQLDPQAHGSAQSYARRYGLQSLVCIGAEDSDGEGAVDRKPAAPVKTATVTTTTNVVNVKIIDSKKQEEAKASPTITSPEVEKLAEKQNATTNTEVPKKRFGGGFGSKAAKVTETNVSTKGDLY